MDLVFAVSIQHSTLTLIIRAVIFLSFWRSLFVVGILVDALSLDSSQWLLKQKRCLLCATITTCLAFRFFIAILLIVVFFFAGVPNTLRKERAQPESRSQELGRRNPILAHCT